MKNTCLIIPCYNEAKKLDLNQFTSFTKDNNEIDLLFINDGSTDATLELLNSIISENISIIHLEQNLGKAEAIRQANLKIQNQYEFIGYLDADLATPLDEMKRLRNILAKDDSILLSFGSRMSFLSNNIQRKNSRHYGGRVIATFIDWILKLGVYDTQCGAKVYRNEFISYFKTPFISKWLFDVELLARVIGKVGRPRTKEIIREVPLNTWIEKGDSKLTLWDIIKTPFLLIRIRRKYF